MDIYLHVGAELHSLCNLMKRISDNSCLCHYRRETELTDMQTRVIGYLFCNQDKDIFQRDIEKAFSIRRPTVSILLQSMEAKKLIYRESVKSDARLKKVVLTDKAKEIATTANQEIIRFEKMLVEDIPEEDLEVFFRVTKQIRNNLEKNFKD